MEADFRKNNRSTNWQELTFAIVGLGLIGGSYAKKLRQLQAKKIIGLEMNPESLAEAKAQGLIDVALATPSMELAEADVLICAIYPDGIVDFVKNNVQFFKSDMLMTDVAGIKGHMIADVQALLPEGMEFISGHPMAGRQGSGLGMSDAAIFENANYIIVPEQKNTPEVIAWLEQFAKDLGCKHTVQVTPSEHDSTIAFTSNLPHITAVALMNSESFCDKTKYFVAGSFRDGTRVADINPELWSRLFLANRDKVVQELDRYMQQLQLWHEALEAADAESLKELMRKSGARRRELYGYVPAQK